VLAEDMAIKSNLGNSYGDYKGLKNRQFEALKATVRQFGSLAQLPPTLRAIQGYKSNYDEFYDEPIYVGPDVTPSAEVYQGYTPERFQLLGKKLGVSPVRSQYFAKQIFTGSNMFATIFAEGVDDVARMVDPEINEIKYKEVARQLNNTPFARRFIRTTNPYTDDVMKEIKQKRNTMKKMHNDKLHEIMDSELDEQGKRDAIQGLLTSAMKEDVKEAERLANRYHQFLTGQDVGNNIYSYLLTEMDHAVRAEAYHERTKRMTDEERNEADQISGQIEDLWSDRFSQRLARLRDRDGVYEE
jgi:hypothetical protein